MSDTFTLCYACGEELEQKQKIKFANTDWIDFYWCPNCKAYINPELVKIVTTEYFNDKGEENEQGNQSRGSKE